MTNFNDFLDWTVNNNHPKLIKKKNRTVILLNRDFIEKALKSNYSISSIYSYFIDKKLINTGYYNFKYLVIKYILNDNCKTINETNTINNSDIKNKNVDNKADKYQPSKNDFKKWNSTSHDIEKNFW